MKKAYEVGSEQTVEGILDRSGKRFTLKQGRFLAASTDRTGPCLLNYPEVPGVSEQRFCCADRPGARPGGSRCLARDSGADRRGRAARPGLPRPCVACTDPRRSRSINGRGVGSRSWRPSICFAASRLCARSGSGARPKSRGRRRPTREENPRGVAVRVDR